jgi:hypothetical protein
MIKRFVLLTLGILLISRFALKETEGFTLSSISSARPPRKEWEVSPPSSEEMGKIRQILSQSYRYLGCGAQCFVFESSDGNYVLKFFKQERYEIPLWLKALPFPFILKKYREQKKRSRAFNISRDFGSYKLAYEELKEETEVVFVHLNTKGGINQPLTLIDRLGIVHKINGNLFEFVLQKKAKLIQPTIQHLVFQGKREEIKELFSKIVGFILDRCKKGLSDRDPNIDTNLGIIDQKIIKIDVGRITHDETYKLPEIYKQELVRITDPFKEWLNRYYPALTNLLEEEIKCQADEK